MSMDIGAAGSYLNSMQQIPLSRGGALIGGTAGSAGETDASFADILAKARESRTGESAAEKKPEAPALSGRKPVIDKTDKLYEQCEALETFLVKTLITGMRNTVQKSNLIDTGFAGQMYEDMLYDEYARDFTRNAGFGLADLAYLELTGQRGKVIADHA
jgi:flagellar protein FlgJ